MRSERLYYGTWTMTTSSSCGGRDAEERKRVWVGQGIGYELGDDAVHVRRNVVHVGENKVM